jgi:hypothetical protein
LTLPRRSHAGPPGVPKDVQDTAPCVGDGFVTAVNRTYHALRVCTKGPMPCHFRRSAAAIG